MLGGMVVTIGEGIHCNRHMNEAKRRIDSKKGILDSGIKVKDPCLEQA